MNILTLRMVWERLARRDPYWAVLTVPEKQGNRWKVDEFFQTGIDDIEYSLANLDRLLPGLPRRHALDFGCGVGRLSYALSRHFESVTGVDIAAQMLKLAQKHQQAGTPSVTFLHNSQSDLRLFPDGEFDLVLSLITLQHNPPKLIEAYVREFVRVVRSGGALYFQLPVFLPPKDEPEIIRRSFYPPTIWKRLRLWTVQSFRQMRRITSKMSMHCLPEARVRKLLEEAGATLVGTIEHQLDHGVRSMIYIARKN